MYCKFCAADVAPKQTVCTACARAEQRRKDLRYTVQGHSPELPGEWYDVASFRTMADAARYRDSIVSEYPTNYTFHIYRND